MVLLTFFRERPDYNTLSLLRNIKYKGLVITSVTE